MTRPRTVGTADEVIEAFVEGRVMRTPIAPVPGGCRLSTDGTKLYSYRTEIAERDGTYPGPTVYFGLAKYGPTTSKWQNRLIREMQARGYQPMAEGERTLHAAVPGRWGGFGPAWHPTGWEEVPTVTWRRPTREERDRAETLAADRAATEAAAARQEAIPWAGPSPESSN